jgi:hypothetical protein
MTHLRLLFLARHGETYWNVAGRWQGHADVPLNATGQAQALALAERLRGAGIAAVATSDLLRARGTAEIVAGALGVQVALVDPDLREQRFGRFEGLTPRECEERYPSDWARYTADPRPGPPGGESRAAGHDPGPRRGPSCSGAAAGRGARRHARRRDARAPRGDPRGPRDAALRSAGENPERRARAGEPRRGAAGRGGVARPRRVSAGDGRAPARAVGERW